MCFFLESFIEVSEEEFKQEDVEPQSEEKGSPDDVQKVERQPEDILEEAPTRLVLIEEEDTKSHTGDEELKEEAEMGGSSSAVNEWEQFDAVSPVGTFSEYWCTNLKNTEWQKHKKQL